MYKIKNQIGLGLRMCGGGVNLLCLFVILYAVFEPQNGIAKDSVLDPKVQKYYALLINVYLYSDGWPTLQNKQSKVDQLAVELEKYTYDVTRIENPDNIELKTEISQFVEKNTAKNNTLFLFYSGHVYTDTLGRSCLIPADSRLPSSQGVSDEKALPVVELINSIKGRQAGNILIAIDSSFSVNNNLVLLNEQMGKVGGKGSSLVLIGAGSAGEAVPIRSYFVDTMIDALEQSQKRANIGVTIKPFCDFLQKNGSRNSWQRPWCRTNTEGSVLNDFTVASGGGHSQKQVVLKGVLKVLPEPNNARVRILNIGPKYTNGGMSLGPGRYHIEVSSKDCSDIVTQWVTLSANEDLDVSINLKDCLGVSSKIPEILSVVSDSNGQLGSEIGELGFSLVNVPKGSFLMGGKRYQEGPAHTVTIRNDFYIMNTEVTEKQYAQYLRYMNQPYMSLQNSDLPMVNVTWDAANKYALWLSNKTQHVYRLPTEAEWEYVAKQGMPSNMTKVQLSGEMQNKILSVSKSWRNTMNIYGMLGNVWEWCSDCWSVRYEKNTVKSSKCSNRVMRGGSWRDSIKKISPTIRSGVVANTQAENIGFRLVREK